MQPVMLDGRAELWVRVLVVRDPMTADCWRNKVESAGIAAQVQLEDALEAAPGSAMLGGALPDLQPFVYSLYVPPGEQDAARAALIDAGWNGRVAGAGRRGTRVDSRYVVRGAVLALMLALFVVLLRIVLG